MSAQRAPRVTIEPVGPADADDFLAAIEDTLQAGKIDRDAVVISVEEPAALPDYMGGSQAADVAERPAPPEDDPEGPDELPCGHEAVWAESGTCMVCDARVGAAATVSTRQQLGDDAGGGRL